ncbi:ATP-binding protein [Marinimicrobium alkaliphilum]|uniref:ATP-binding protein n=1 Tax=Marinimicrobium alkaliphilum TaxID=2202654 RepID=UPI000DBA7FC2|nr:ATP-binding protein [Marinimicrobium alkaliphilum]
MDTEAQEQNSPVGRVQKVTYPWLSALAALGLVSYFAWLTLPMLSARYPVPPLWQEELLIYALLVVFVVLVLWDVRRYLYQYRRQRADLRLLRTQVSDLWRDKKQLQLKAHTYSGHAEKLKLFISDKLLDYIEYDEKFLHFKSIAAEVRHNGVISFDKVQRALQLSVDDTASGAESEANREALDAMRYLWDLLDLSTADNLALHIGNLLCECEEHYYQRLLNVEQARALPFEPVYSPQRAAWRALTLVCGERPPAPVADMDYLLSNNQWYVRLAPVAQLLGNENHLVLLLENLLKNAQYFAGKRGYKSPFASVALVLEEREGQVLIRVYNRGPHVSDEDRTNLFQLGFSTRRVREHHGRGLGLYFVNEIVKGYEGRVEVHNIHTRSARYTVRIELENGELATELLEVSVSDGQPQVVLPDGGTDDARHWQFRSPIRSVEVTTTGTQGSDGTQCLADFVSKGKDSRFDPAHPERPQWRIHSHAKRGDHQLSFEPLAITGVEFEVCLPSAQQRLDNEAVAIDENIDEEVERLDGYFKPQAV